MHIIQNYIHNLIDNLPNTSIEGQQRQKSQQREKSQQTQQTQQRQNMNIILDGGIFNGSYLIGCLYFLQEMEIRNYICIKKISSCSISSVCSLLYYIGALDLMPELYTIIVKQFKEHCNLNIFDACFDKIKTRIHNPDALCKRINNRLYITYYNISKKKKIVKCKYCTIDDIFETIHRSCFIPFVANGEFTYKKWFCDGMTPYMFPYDPKCKLLYIDLFGMDKIGYLLSIKNEKTNIHRILAGLLDIHLFFIKNCSTQMCSYVEHWSLGQTIYHRGFKLFFETCIFYCIYILYYLKQYIPGSLYEHIVFKILSRVARDIYYTCIEYYCF